MDSGHAATTARARQERDWLGVLAALLPFGVVLVFGWLRTGSLVPLRFLLGRGDLLPSAAMLAGQALAVAYGVPARQRTTRWTGVVGAGWLVVTVSVAGFMVPYADPTGADARLLWASIAAFAIGVAVKAATAVIEEDA
jgi:hypothetical protein